MITATTSPSATPTSSLRSLMNQPAAQELIKFMGVGVSSVLLTVIILNTCQNRLAHVIADDRLRLLASNTIAFAITLSTAFFLNSRITFKNKHAGPDAYARYALVNVVGFGLNTLLLMGFSAAIAAIRGQSYQEMHTTFVVNVTLLGRTGKVFVGDTIALLGAVGVVFFWNFFMSRLWVFRARDGAAGGAPGSRRAAIRGGATPQAQAVNSSGDRT